MNIIIKSGKKNWSGKEFSNLPAKIYSSFDDVVSTLMAYHFYKFNEKKCEYVPCEKKQKIEIIPLTGKRQEALLSAGLVRF